MVVKNIKFFTRKTKIEQSTLLSVDLWSGREKKKRETGMARKRAENREGSLGFPGSLLRALKSEDSNCLPLSVVRIAGVPKRDTQEEKKASATVSAVMSLRG
ncbi:hypothetical protein TNCV_4051181 [Trichonephila clavipes]|nr:hypothetical protein TNCV_4051181 [Trichonephila clavipes]